MDAIELLTDLALRPLHAAEALQPKLTRDLLNAHPHHDNSIAWQLWHAAREIDEQLSHLSGAEPVWTAQGFDERFGLGVPAHDLGYGHSPEAARAVVVDDAGLLVEHLRAVVEAQVAYLGGLEPGALDEIVDDRWDPPVSRGARLISISVDAAEHIGQAAYVAGMGPAAFEG